MTSQDSERTSDKYESEARSEKAGSEKGYSENKNPYLDALGKRLRTLKKKLQKILKYDQLESSKLNLDQIQAVDRKEAIVLAMKEMEELSKSFLIIQQDLILLESKKEDDRQQELSLTIESAVTEAKKIPKSLTSTLLEWIGLLNDRLESAEFYLDPTLFNSLLSLHKILCSNEGYDHAQALLSKSESIFMGYSYAHLAKTIESLTLPVKSDKMSFFVTNEISTSKFTLLKDHDEYLFD